jgi:excinuclease ABC subunit A
VIDLGPEGGDAGGKVVCAGPPELLVAKRTHTGVALAPVLRRGGATIDRVAVERGGS